MMTSDIVVWQVFLLAVLLTSRFENVTSDDESDDDDDVTATTSSTTAVGNMSTVRIAAFVILVSNWTANDHSLKVKDK